MEKFKDLKYKRPDLKKYEEDVRKLFEDFNNKTLEEQIDIISKYFKISDELTSVVELAQIRATLNREDDFYKKEEDFLNESLPPLGVVNEFVNKCIISSSHKEGLEKHFGKQMFTLIELSMKVFSEEIVPELQEENKLSSEYESCLAMAQIDFEGEKLNIQQIFKYSTSTARDIRKKALEAISGFFNDNKDKINKIYNDMVLVRDKMAKKLGYNDYCEMSYDRLQRIGYNIDDIRNYRKQIKDVIIPISKLFRKVQEKELGIKNLKYYDTSLNFKDGNPKPKGSPEELLKIAQKMYSEMSNETKEFFNMMVERELLDLEARKGKQGGGYCTYLPHYQAPFIFSNFNGTSADVDVLTHETGHAFQVYQSKDLISPYYWPGMEGAEVYSMSMEFLAWPWMKDFFKEDYKKYLFEHLKSAILFLPYGALIDHFQEQVYKNINLTQDKRNELFRKLEKEYLPFKDYDGNEFFEQGMFYFIQSHVFSAPFYYIDYTLAQVIAFQFLNLDRKNHDDAWNKYFKMTKLGGSKPFLDTIKDAGLMNPFDKGAIKKILKPLLKLIKEFIKELF